MANIGWKRCDMCEREFMVGKGHNMWCKSCNVVHPTCEKCYRQGKASGIIKDKKVHISDLDEKERDKLK